MPGIGYGDGRDRELVEATGDVIDTGGPDTTGEMAGGICACACCCCCCDAGGGGGSHGDDTAGILRSGETNGGGRSD